MASIRSEAKKNDTHLAGEGSGRQAQNTPSKSGVGDRAIRYFSFEMFHGKSDVGSTRLRVHQMINHWPEAALYKYGENPDVMIFQKVYLQPDWQFMAHFKGIKILDICDSDWLAGAEVKRSLDAVDGATCPTETFAGFLRQLTDKPIKVIPDRHELKDFKKQANHVGPIKSVVWFGYKHNASSLRWAMNFLARNDVKLTVVSNEDPLPYQWADDPDKSQKLYKFVRFEQELLNEELIKHDAALLPIGSRPVDRFKSNNRTIIARLCGLPIITDDTTFEKYNDPGNRREPFDRDAWDVRQSVREMKEFIELLLAA